MSWFSRLQNVFRPDSLSDDVGREMASHLQQRADDLVRGGMKPEDAKAEARRRFGNPGRHSDETRDRDVFNWLEAFVTDARYAWRSIRRTPGFTVLVVATLALGVGVNSAMFSFLDRVFLRAPTGIEDPASLRRLWITRTRDADALVFQGINYPTYLAFRDLAASSANVAVFTTSDGMRIGRNRDAPPVHGVFATANYFDVLGVRPVMGRTFAADEDVMGAGAKVLLISDAFWKTRLGSDPAILGKQINLGIVSYTVIGVLPKDFVGVQLQPADVWMPLGAFEGRLQRGKPWYETSTTYGLRTVMRVDQGFDDQAFGARAALVSARVEQELRPDRAGPRFSIVTGSIIEARGPGALSPETTIATRLAGVGLIVLLIAIANVINLLLARAVRRRQEIAVRLALGISRWRLVRLLVTESAALALLAGGAAILTALWGGKMLRSLLTPDVEWIDTSLDGRVVLFALGVALLAGIIAGAIPAFQASNPKLAAALKSGAREGFVSRSRLRAGLVIVQAAFSVVLLVGAALCVRTLRNVQGIDIGYDVQQTLMAELLFEPGEAPPDAVVDAALRDLAARMEGRAGVERVARAAASPMRGYGVQMFYAGTFDRSSVSSDFGPLFSAVSPGFFDATGLRLVRGRTLGGPETGPGPNEVVLNEIAARFIFPGSDAIGQCVHFAKRENPCHTVVGVVENSNTMELIESKMGQFYVPLGSAAAAAASYSGSSLVVRARLDAIDAVRNELRREIRRALPLAQPFVLSMSENLESRYRPWRLGATLFTAFGALALLVALVGIYSSVSYMVGQRMHEFGVRIALGARMRDVLNQVLGEGLRVVAIGVAAGVLIALIAGRLVRSLLFGVESSDPSALLLAACLLLAVAAIAALVPALRAARVDPVVALRSD